MSGLPEGWTETTVDNIAHLVRGVSYKKHDATDVARKDYTAILRANNIQAGEIVVDALIYVPCGYVSEDQYLKPGDTLIATSSGSRDVVGKSALAGDKHRNYSFGAFCGIIRPAQLINSKWLSYYSKTSSYRSYIASVALGININNFRTSDIKSMPVPLAPLAEQRRIVAKLDRLFARTSRARAELGHIPQLIERYRAIFLVKLFDSVNGVKKRLKDLVPPSAPIRYGVVQPGEIKDQGIQLIRVCDLLNNRVAWNQLRRVSPEVDSKYLAARVDNGDVLLSVVGTIGRVAIVRDLTEPTNIARAVARIRPNSELVRSEWLMWRLQAQDMQDRFTGDAREVARKTLNVSLVKEAEVILPPLDEQDSMVAKINTAFEVLDRTYKETVAAHDQTVRLVEVSLAKAFQGKLVPQDPNDEPASELLDRIRAERAARSNNGRNHRRK